MTYLHGITEFDPTSGLPSVPAGYFWRVVPPRPDSNYYWVHLCQLSEKRGRWGRVTQAVIVIGGQPVSRANIGPEAILSAACFALNSDLKILRHIDRMKPIRTDLLGDYPPKLVTQ